MTDPAHPDPSNRAHPRPGGQHRDSVVDEVGIDAVQKPAEYIAGSEDQHDADGACDHQTDDRVGGRKPQRRTNGSPTTANDVKPSARACIPSARKAADPMRLPTRMRYRATISLPRNPTKPA